MKAKIGIASDHAGKELKALVQDFLTLTEHDIVDYGVDPNTEQSVDYPDYAAMIAEDIMRGKIDRGIAICGTGIGMCITANKFPGVRATLAWDEFTAKMARAHNDSNILCLGARTVHPLRAVDYVKIWLDTPYESGRHNERLKKIAEIEKKYHNRST